MTEELFIKIREAIKTTLVIENKNSINYTMLRIAKDVDKETSALRAENERLRGLIEKAHSEGYEDAVHHIEYAKSLKQFKTENNL